MSLNQSGHMALLPECKNMLELIMNQPGGVYLPRKLVLELHGALRSLLTYGLLRSAEGSRDRAGGAPMVDEECNSWNHHVCPTTGSFPPVTVTAGPGPLPAPPSVPAAVASPGGQTNESVMEPIVAWRAPHWNAAPPPPPSFAFSNGGGATNGFMSRFAPYGSSRRPTNKATQACHDQRSCTVPDCPRVHGDFDPKQGLYLETLRARGDKQVGNVACRHQLRGRACHPECTYRHFVPGTVRALTLEQMLAFHIPVSGSSCPPVDGRTVSPAEPGPSSVAASTPIAATPNVPGTSSAPAAGSNPVGCTQQTGTHGKGSE